MKFFQVWTSILVNSLTFVHSIELPEEIYDICPYSNICNRTAKRTLDVEGLIPCCSSCSCDEDCGLHLDCCFDHFDKYKLVQNGKVACVNARIANENNEAVDNKRHSYNMVTTCELDTSQSGKEQHNSFGNCRMSDAFGNSLIAPVSTKETDQIYVNEECAKCNNVRSNRINTWNYLLSSERTSTKFETTVTFDIEQNVKNNLGVIIYTPPAQEDWSHKSCAGKYIEVNSCNKNEIWQELCTNLHLPFQSLLTAGKYKNVFCDMCKGSVIERIIKECKVLPERGPTSKGLTVLLDSEVLEFSKFAGTFKDQNIANSGNACPSGYINHQDNCLAIYCPEGMINTPNGCSYFALRWFIQKMVMHINLIPTSGTTLKVSQLQTKEGLNPFSWLKIPCRKLQLTSIEVFYSQEYGNYSVDYVTSCVIRILKSVDMVFGVDPSTTISMFYKCVHKTWKAIIGNVTYSFDPYFDKYSWEVAERNLILKKWPEDDKFQSMHKTRPMKYKLLSLTDWRLLRTRGNSIELKKPFFCKQVRIPQFDVEVRFGEIRIISKNITLGTNEYLVNVPISDTDPTQREWNKTTFSVCVEDYDPSFRERSDSAPLAKSCILAVAFFGSISSFCFISDVS